jgi:TPR repeat protein
MLGLGLCYLEGGGVEVDETRGLSWIQKAADLGEPMAMSRVGWCWERGEGVGVSIARAGVWYWKAADSHDFLAFRLGMLVNRV